MKKILLLILPVLLAATAVTAQPWMPKDAKGPVKLADIEKEYKAHPIRIARGEEEEEMREKSRHGKVVKEEDDYLFQRWMWYWQQHLDENGYMVNPSKTWEEWEKYLANTPVEARTTAGTPANWVFQGPDSTPGGYSGLGRINAIALHPYDQKIIYAGSAGGGIWKSIDSGRSWTSLYSNFMTLGVSDIVVNPLNPNTIYVATGDADGWGNYSMGVVKSTDGGTTWGTTSLNWTPFTYNWIRSMVVNPRDTNKYFLATRGGIMMTNNSFASSSTVKAGDYSQVLYHPTDTSIIYAAQYPTNPDSSAQIYRSTNGGATWTQVTHFTDVQRIAMAVCPTRPNLVKAIASNQKSGLHGIYSSSNAGATFDTLYYNDTFCVQNLLSWDMGMPSTSCGGQGWYDLCIAIDPNDSNKVVVGGVNNYYSNDGGRSWQIANTWYTALTGVATVHADKHCLKYSPLDHTLYEGCDGGIYRTAGPVTSSWDNITNGMGITQFYRNAVADGAPWAIGGAQDNGTKMINAGTDIDLTGGDGMQCRIDYADPLNTWYTSSQNGWINLTTDAGAHYHSVSSTIPDTLNGIWITPYVLHPHDHNSLLVGIDILFSSNDQGTSWTAISPQFTPLSMINHIAVTPADDNVIYACVEGRWNYHNTLHYTTNYGATWDTITTYAFPNSISRIAADPKKSNILWATFSGYGTEKVGYYNTTTNTWVMRNGGLPNIPVNCIVIDSFSGTKYVGTDIAVYYMDTLMSTWALYATNLPKAQVEDLNINYATGELWAATYGRGMWKTIKREVPNGISEVPYAADVITVSPNPNRGTFTIKTNQSQLKGQSVNVRILSSSGTTVWAQDASFDASGALKVTTRGLPAGVYICETGNDKTIARCRVMIY